MKQLVLIIVVLLGLAGCSTFKETAPPANETTASTVPGRSDDSPKPPRSDASRKLSSALQKLEQGRRTAAITILEEIIAEPGVKGVTDEALFRLGVLKLFYKEKDGSASSIPYLERLGKEYGDSPWTQQAKPLLEFLYAVADMNYQNRNLKAQNSSLSKENKELHKSINRLKNLDLQMERNAR